MDGAADARLSKGTPQLECRSCRFPVLISFVVHDGDSRALDCPYCGRHDEWTITPRA
jgi:DNA-directed RNA polymerase subunit RPC12/RpoP